MAFVSVPKDLTKVKNKIIFNLTKRQLICLGIAAAVGLSQERRVMPYDHEKEKATAM